MEFSAITEKQAINFVVYGFQAQKIRNRGKSSTTAKFYVLDQNYEYLQWLAFGNKEFVEMRLNLKEVLDVNTEYAYPINEANYSQNIAILHTAKYDLCISFLTEQEQKLFLQGI